jgi:hypothetical protein
MRNRLGLAAGALVVLLSAGCGSTVAGGGAVSPANGLGVPAAAGAGATAGSSGSAGAPGATSGLSAPSGIGSSATAGGGAHTQPGAPTSTGSTAPVAGTAVSAPGITGTTIYIGASYVADAAAADSALGTTGLNPGNTQDEANVLIRYMNNHGGIAHRKIVPIWFEGSATQNVQNEYQQACSKWTQDNKTFAFGLGDLAGGNPLFDQCAANAHAFNMTTGGVALEDRPTLQRFGTDIDLTELSDDDAMRDTIAGLSRQSYFSGGAKVGIATWDQPDFAYGVKHVALPMLARLGVNNVPVQYVAVPQSEGDLSATSASINNAVLKFRTMGIDHVLLFDGTAGINGAGTLVLLWMNDAQSQHYNPRYGLNSTSGLSTLAPDLPAQQMAGSLAVGWIPVLDETQHDYPASKYPAAGKACLRIMAAGGEKPTTVNQTGSELGICDWLFFLKQVLDPIAGTVTVSNAMASINGVGRSFSSGAVFGVDVTGSRHDGVSTARNAAFVGSCTCYRYTSAAYRIG